MKRVLLTLAAAIAVSADTDNATAAGEVEAAMESGDASTAAVESGEEETPLTLEEQVAANTAHIETTHADMDTVWIMTSGILVFFMQAGFSMLEAGCVSIKNVQNILYKNLMDACLGAIGFWLLGFGFAYGSEEDGKFIGSANFALWDTNNDSNSYHVFFFQWAFAATAATIVSGSVAERCKLEAYFVYSMFLTIFVYPVVVHWVWDTEGWLCAWGTDKIFSGDDLSNGMIDFAGSGVVHMVGGFSGLMGAIALGPRLGRFEEGNEAKFAPHNTLVASLGVAILWYGWYGFNAGSTLLVSGGTANLAAKCCVTTTLAAAAAATTCTFYSRIANKNFDLMLSLNGVLAGLVSITAGCSVVDPLQALAIGILGGLVYIATSALLKKLKIDDPLDAFPIHGCCGFWGVISVGIFATDANVLYAYGNDNTAVSRGEQFGVQFVAALAIAGWTMVTSGFLFFVLKSVGMLRVDADTEAEGLDLSEHGGAAYAKDVMGLKSDTEMAVAQA